MTQLPHTVSFENWQSFLENQYPNAHLLQSAAWGKLKSAFGWRAYPLRRGQSGALLLVRQLLPGLRIGYIPKGPVGNWLEDLIPALDEVGDSLGLSLIKVEPDATWEASAAHKLQAAGFSPSNQTVQPARTLIVDLSAGLQATLDRMHQKTRYNIRLSRRKGIEVEPWDDLDAFSSMMNQTADRQSFGAHTADYYRTAHQLFHTSDQCALLVAKFEGKPVASLMVFASGERAFYFYGASTQHARKRMPTYGLQWAAMQWAHERGCLSYDLWGVPDQPADALEAEFTQRSDGLWGVYRFKRGFGGELVKHMGAWDRPQRRLGYGLYRLAARAISAG